MKEKVEVIERAKELWDMMEEVGMTQNAICLAMFRASTSNIAADREQFYQKLKYFLAPRVLAKRLFPAGATIPQVAPEKAIVLGEEVST